MNYDPGNLQTMFLNESMVNGLVPKHIHNLFTWYQQAKLYPLIKSAVFHYEFEFIHPFADGNGRMGRMWHNLLLGKWKELFFWLPIEELIQSRQKEYYDALGMADKQADSAGFVELMLEIIRDSLKEVTVVGRSTDQDNDQVTDQDKTPIERLLSTLGDHTLSAAELMERLGLSHRRIRISPIASFCNGLPDTSLSLLFKKESFYRSIH